VARWRGLQRGKRPLDAGRRRYHHLTFYGFLLCFAATGVATLYIHGGAFMMGSPHSHRTLTTRFSAMAGGAVLAIDYRLMPEHPRRAGIEDCRSAYRWLLANGPDGAAPAQARRHRRSTTPWERITRTSGAHRFALASPRRLPSAVQPSAG
jgi:hypothetical protein